jgi:hypothetical protein
MGMGVIVTKTIYSFTAVVETPHDIQLVCKHTITHCLVADEVALAFFDVNRFVNVEKG